MVIAGCSSPSWESPPCSLVNPSPSGSSLRGGCLLLGPVLPLSCSQRCGLRLSGLCHSCYFWVFLCSWINVFPQIHEGKERTCSYFRWLSRAQPVHHTW